MTTPTRIESRTGDAPHRLDDGLLCRAATLFAAAVIIHNGDHLRRGVDKLHGDVFGAGMAGIVVEVTLVVLIFQHHRLAPVAAALGGASLALAYVEVHFLSAHSVLSDSFTSAPHTSPLSWAAASFEILAAVVLAASGLVVLRRRGGLASTSRPHAAPRSLVDAVTRPVPLILIATQAIAVILSLVEVIRG
jgi:hypothetical protein